jgi:hypothetical protein
MSVSGTIADEGFSWLLLLIRLPTNVCYRCKAAAGTSSAQRRIIEHLSFSAVSTSWAHNSAPSIFKNSPHQLIRGALCVTVFE